MSKLIDNPFNGVGIGGTITGGTVGSVLFVGAGGLLAQDNAKLFWDDTNNFLGIGTNVPLTPLYISGTDYSGNLTSLLSTALTVQSYLGNTITTNTTNTYIGFLSDHLVNFASDPGARSIQALNSQVNVPSGNATGMTGVTLNGGVFGATYSGSGGISAMVGTTGTATNSGSGTSGNVTGVSGSCTISGTPTLTNASGSSVTSTVSGAATITTLAGINATGTLSNASATVTTISGGTYTAILSAAATVANMIAINCFTNITAAGVITSVEGTRGRFANAGAATITNARALNVVTWGNTVGAGVITNAYGLQIGAITNTGTITSTYGIRIDAMTGAGTHTNVPYGIYQTGTADYNYFGGKSVFGGTSGLPTTTASNTIVNNGVTNSQLALRSQRAAIVSGNVLGGIDFVSDDTNLTAPGTIVAAIQALALATHTASVLTTDLVFSATTTLAFAEGMRLTGALNLGIGTGATVSAKLHVISTTEQSRYGYDASNYCSITVGSTGITTLNAVGSGARFAFSDGVTLPAGTTGAGTSPLLMTTGSLMTTAEVGAMEYNNDLHFSNWKLVRYSIGGTINESFADVTVGGAETDIFTFTTIANTLGTNGDKLVASYSGNFVTVGTELTQLKVYFGGTAIWDSTGVAPTTGTTSWRVYTEIIRVSSTVVRFVVSLNTTGASGFVYATSGELTGLTLSNTNIVKITGTSSGVGSGSGDIVGKMHYIQFSPAK